MITACTIILLFTVVLLHGHTDTGSMIPTIVPGNGHLSYRFAYISEPVERYDVVVFKSQEPGDNSLLVKRVIGLPGDTVFLNADDQRVYINGDPVSEPYLNEPPYNYDDQTYTVPEGHYFMMGDNRNHSSDSRVWGYLDKEDIIGRVFLRYNLWGENGFYFKGVPRGAVRN